MMSSLMRANDQGAVLEQVVIQGDLSKLSPTDRVAYYKAVCESVGLNPLTKPFDYINLNGKLTLYCKRDATEQLRKIYGISVTRLERDYQDDIYVVTAYGQDREGRVDSATGAVAIGGLRGEARANALMKAETKAKRRLTLSLAGLGWLDETETDSIPDAVKPPTIETEGVIDIQPQQPPPSPRPHPAPGIAPQSEPMCTKQDYDVLVQTAKANGWERWDVNAYLKAKGFASIRQVPTSAFGEALEHFSRPVEVIHEEAADDAADSATVGETTDPATA